MSSKLKKPIPRFIAVPKKQHDIPIRYPKCYRWQFPLGEKMAVLYIEGTTELDMADMNDLVKICLMFRKSIKKRQPMQDDYSI